MKVVSFVFQKTENESLEVFTEIRGCCGIVSGLVISPGFRYYRIRQPHSLLHPPTFLTTATSTSTIISTSKKKINNNINPFTGFGNRPPPSAPLAAHFQRVLSPFFLQGFSSFADFLFDNSLNSWRCCVVANVLKKNYTTLRISKRECRNI